ncbi:MAG: putative DNA binding domain-containing protein, partial [Firmicutes bacterium]|nr:putative DNA binding domain-containing protein [Bacillota bacterium]
MLSLTDVIEIIKNGESPYIEFKEEEVKPNDLAGEIVAFSNMEGGTILIGVSDEGVIKGVKDGKIEEKVMNICRNNCIPGVIPIYEEITIEGKTISVVTIPKGKHKPYYT